MSKILENNLKVDFEKAINEVRDVLNQELKEDEGISVYLNDYSNYEAGRCCNGGAYGLWTEYRRIDNDGIFRKFVSDTSEFRVCTVCGSYSCYSHKEEDREELSVDEVIEEIIQFIEEYGLNQGKTREDYFIEIIKNGEEKIELPNALIMGVEERREMALKSKASELYDELKKMVENQEENWGKFNKIVWKIYRLGQKSKRFKLRVEHDINDLFLDSWGNIYIGANLVPNDLKEVIREFSFGFLDIETTWEKFLAISEVIGSNGKGKVQRAFSNLAVAITEFFSEGEEFKFKLVHSCPTVLLHEENATNKYYWIEADGEVCE